MTYVPDAASHSPRSVKYCTHARQSTHCSVMSSITDSAAPESRMVAPNRRIHAMYCDTFIRRNTRNRRMERSTEAPLPDAYVPARSVDATSSST